MPSILVVDSHPVNLRLMRGQLAALRHQCDSAADTHDALALWKKGHHRLVIADCPMPGHSGQELTQRIREMEARKSIRDGIPILAWSTDGMSANLRRCREAGMNGHLLKPTLLDTLREVLALWLPHQAPPAAPTSPSSNAAATSTPSILDESVLRVYSGGDEKIEREIFTQFLDINEQDIAALETTINARDLAKTRWLARRIRGNCRIIGAHPMADVFEQIERAIQAGDWSTVIDCDDDIRREQGRLIDLMKTRLRGDAR